jgi:hypothetical protein
MDLMDARTPVNSLGAAVVVSSGTPATFDALEESGLPEEAVGEDLRPKYAASPIMTARMRTTIANTLIFLLILIA